MAGDAAQQPAELVAAGGLELVAVVVRRHPVGLVDDHQVPVGLLQVGQQLVAAGQLVHPGDEQRVRQEHLAVKSRLDHGPGQNLEPKAELVVQLVLPLLHQRSGSHDQATGQVAAQEQLLDVQTAHDRLAGTRIVGQQEAQRRPVQHRAVVVDRPDLVRQWADIAGGDGQHRIEVGRIADAQSLGREPPRLRIAVEGADRPGPGLDAQIGLGIAAQDHLVRPTTGVQIGQRHQVATVPRHRDHIDRSRTDRAGNRQTRGQVLEAHPDGAFEFRVT